MSRGPSTETARKFNIDGDDTGSLSIMGWKQNRLRRLNGQPISRSGHYVLYWLQLYRRLRCNHALDYAIKCSKELRKPLVIYDGLRLDYPWASARLHQFALQGMRDNLLESLDLGITYWPYVETPEHPARGLLKSLAEKAALVVTDDFPCFIVPGQSAALAEKVSCAVYAVDGNGIVPLAMLGQPAAAAAHLRSRLQKAFVEAWPLVADAAPQWPSGPVLPAPFATFAGEVDALVRALPVDQSVAPVALVGGPRAAAAQLQSFVASRLKGYAEGRSVPRPPAAGHCSGLSPYLHFGHISIEEVVAAVLATVDDFSLPALKGRKTGKRQGYYTADLDVSAFLDEAITWRDIGFHWHWHRREDAVSLERALPAWACKSLQAHAADLRTHVYTRAEFEAGQTHDALWNAAQKELVKTGGMHNYLRMLWGKKVIEWSVSPEAAYRTLEHLNNKYALDGRNPNSYTGILWCFGLFDRPWPPERPVFGNVRYMSSDNTAKKFKLKEYLAYVDALR